MKKLFLPIVMLALMGQGCFSLPTRVTPPATPEVTTPAPTPVPTPMPTPESSEQNMPPQEDTTQPPPNTSTYNVSIQNYAYVQASITVKKGDKIIFQNRDTVAHSVTADAGAFDSGLVGGGKSFTLDTSSLAAGTYSYHCTPHPLMKGTVIVK